MIKVTVKNLHFKDLEALQLELDIFNKYVAIKELQKDFLNTIITFDIVNNLYYLLRTRIEQGKKEYTVSFTTSQAATILKCCNFNRADRDLYTNHVMTKLSIDLHKQLTDLV
jgi:DNA-binding GntR family transcriptional regulator